MNEEGEQISRHNASDQPIGCGMIFSKRTLEDLGYYNSDYLCHEDRELMLRFEASNCSKLNIPIPLYRYRMHDKNMTLNKKRMTEFEKKLGA